MLGWADKVMKIGQPHHKAAHRFDTCLSVFRYTPAGLEADPAEA